LADITSSTAGKKRRFCRLRRGDADITPQTASFALMGRRPDVLDR
jgi:hypothetical protein